MPINSFLYPGAKVTTGYDVDNSVRLDTNTTFTRTLGASPTNAKKGTISFWFKKVSTPNSSNYGRFVHIGSTSNDLGLYTISDTIAWYVDAGTNGSGLTTGRKYRDESAWYHLIFSLDSTLGTAVDRIKLYVNGELQDSSSFPQNTNVTLNTDIFDASHLFCIGATNSTSLAQNLDGYISEFVYIDGTALDETSFGEFDDSGIWKPIDVSGLTFGTNGFYLDFENSGSLGADVSGNGNNFTANNLTAIDQSTDTCTNNFATLNPLDQKGGITFSDGNLSVASTSASWRSTRSTFGITQGKWYFEVKPVNTSGSLLDMMVGIGDFSIAIPSEFSSSNPALTYTAGSGNKQLNGVNSSYGASYNVNDIIGVFFDADNLTVEFFKNGTSQGSISTGWSSGITWTPIISLYGRYNNTKASFNFGSPVVSISSGNTDPDGYGNFEYSTNNGYALNSKNLAEYG